MAMALFVVALLLAAGMSLALYWQSQRELAAERARQLKLEAALVAARLGSDVSESALRQVLISSGILAAATVVTPEGQARTQVATIDRLPPDDLLAPPDTSGDAGVVRTTRGFDIIDVPLDNGDRLLMAKPAATSASPFLVYIFSYQIIALIFGLGIIFLVVRWLLKPYRRILEAAKGSPVRVSSAMGETEFVVDTFQALVSQLQDKERELAVLHDLERMRADKSERFSERLIANIPSGLVAMNSRGLVTSANAYAREIFGEARPAAQANASHGRTGGLQELSVDYRAFFVGAPRIIPMVSECLSNGKPVRRGEVELTYPDGRNLRLGLSISPITDDDQTIEGALCMMTDITEVTDLRERMKLQENLANLGEMAAGLAHEFKNSLATIHGYAQLLEAQSDSTFSAADKSKALDAMLGEVRLLARLVTDFLNFARPQQLAMAEVDMAEIINDCAQELRPQLLESGIELHIKGSFARLAGDETMLRRAFSNLLRNAVEAIDPHGGERVIEITASIDGKPGRYAHITIRDTGGGIALGDLSRIFIPFYTTKSRGYGIGLAIVQKILVAHGGDVSVERSDSSGTTFHCRLPLDPPLSMKENSQAVD